MGLLSFLNPLNAIVGALERAYSRKLAADTDEKRIAADVEISNLEAKRDAVIAAAATDTWHSPRSIMGYSVAILVFKLLVWDTVLGLGSTPYPGQMVTWIMVTVIGFYFVSRSAETITNSIAGVLAKRNR